MPERQHAFGAAEVLGKGFARRPGDHAWSREVELGARLSDADVGEGREAGQDTARARVRENGDEGDGCLVHEIHRAGRLGHLHQAEDALLHAGSTGAAHGHNREPVVGRQLGAAPEPLADDTAHAAAHEAEIDDGEHALAALDLDSADDDGF